MRILKTAIMLIILISTSRLYSEAIFAGNAFSVNPQSGMNALRNPALMSKQRWETASLYYTYSKTVNYESDMKFFLSNTEFASEYSKEESYNGIFYFSQVFRDGKDSFGIGVTEAKDGQMIFSNGTFKIDYDSTSVSSEAKNFGSSLLLSYSHNFGSGRSAGLQLETSAYQDISEEKKQSGSLNYKLNIEKKVISSSLLLGFDIVEDDFEIGGGITSGRHGFESISYKQNNYMIPSKTSRDISNYYLQTDGIMSLLGISYKPLKIMRFNIETAGVVPYSHKEKEYDKDYLITKSEKEIDLKYGIITRAGVSIYFSRFVSAGFGGGALLYSADTSNSINGTDEKLKLEIYTLNSGIDIKPSESYSYILGIGWERRITELKQKNTISLTEIEITETKDYIKLTAGSTYYF